MTDTFDGRNRIFELLRKKGAVGAHLDFSGGNDEGGVDGMSLIFPLPEGATPTGEPFEDGKHYLVVDFEVHYSSNYFNATLRGPWSNEDQELSELLQIPVDTEYGSWAGEFSAYGTLDYRVGETTLIDTVKMRNFVQSEYAESEEDW